MDNFVCFRLEKKTKQQQQPQQRALFFVLLTHLVLTCAREIIRNSVPGRLSCALTSGGSLPFRGAACPEQFVRDFPVAFLTHRWSTSTRGGCDENSVVVFVVVGISSSRTLRTLNFEYRQPLRNTRDQVMLLHAQQTQCRAYALPFGQGFSGTIGAQRHVVIFQFFRQHSHAGLHVSANGRVVARLESVTALLELLFRGLEPSALECFASSFSTCLFLGCLLCLSMVLKVPRDWTGDRFLGIRRDEFRVLGRDTPVP